MPRKNHGPMVGLRTGDPVHTGGRNGRVTAAVPGSEPDACLVRFEDGGHERHNSNTLRDGRCDGQPATGWC